MIASVDSTGETAPNVGLVIAAALDHGLSPAEVAQIIAATRPAVARALLELAAEWAAERG